MTSLPLNCLVDFLVWTDYKHLSVSHYYSELTLSCSAAVPQYFLPTFVFFSCSFDCVYSVYVCFLNSSQSYHRCSRFHSDLCYNISLTISFIFLLFSLYMLTSDSPSSLLHILSDFLPIKKYPFLTLLSFELITDQQSNSVWTSHWTKCKIL